VVCIQPHRIVGGHRVEVRRQQVAPLGQLALVPSGALQPFAGFEGRDGRTHPGHGLGDAGHVAERHVVHLVDAGFGDVRVTVDEPGRGGAAVQIDAAGGRVGQFQNVAVRAHGDDLAVANGDGLHRRILGIDRQNVSVETAPIEAPRRLGRAPRQTSIDR
jgi:hypothetical protein